jgi:DNA-binding beta-propeller fold protein YncE
MRRLVPILLGGLLVLLSVGVDGAVAQERPVDGAGTVLAAFRNAQALGIDPRGRLYVADAARDVVAVLGPRGTRKMVLGGSGTRAGEFDTPADVDPTNGQLILVADTYNGRIQRFSEEGQSLESLPIGRRDRRGGEGWSFQDGRDGAAVRGDGRPVAVAQDDEGTLFVLDERTRQLLTWSDLGRSGQIREAEDDRLQDPVALAVGGARLYVADAEKEAVLIYDTFGTFLRSASLPPLPGVRALAVHRGRLHVVCADRVLVWTREKGLVAEHPVDLSEPLVDAAFDENRTYLLTATRLLRRSGW